MSEHRIGPGAYLVALVVLIVLAAISYGVSFLPLGAWETPVAMLISAAKGTVVLLIFMHLLEQATINAVVMIIATAMVVLLISLVGLDIVTRVPPPALPPEW
ncbi:cytochrome C oxidase subunit IV family protein [Myxococcota bacterium]|nr:cytochrome C oxidase subunit IV family protein [Myxococcota bacterium]